VIGFSAPRLAKSRTAPGCGIVARFGGFPPETAVDTICGTLSPEPLLLLARAAGGAGDGERRCGESGQPDQIPAETPHQLAPFVACS
jgi:hypothetical protein